VKFDLDRVEPEGELAAFGPDGPALRAYLGWLLPHYPQYDLRIAREAICACAAGDFTNNIQNAGSADTIVVLLELEQFVRARCLAKLN